MIRHNLTDFYTVSNKDLHNINTARKNAASTKHHVQIIQNSEYTLVLTVDFLVVFDPFSTISGVTIFYFTNGPMHDASRTITKLYVISKKSD